jgi:histone H3/H4
MAASAPITEQGNASGQAGLVAWAAWAGGDPGIERVPELMWPSSVTTYQAMLNDAQAFSLWMSLILPIRSYHWYIEPNGARPEVVERISRNYNLPVGRDQAEFNRRRAQRRFSFDKHLEDALRALYYGHMYFEQVGEMDIDPASSVLVWNLRKLGIRSPRTLSEINVNTDGGLKSIRQASGPFAPEITVDRLVAYVWDREGANWAGRSLFRSIYRNWLTKDRVLRVGAINIERAGGVPYANAPEGASGPEIAALDILLRNFRVGEKAGVALPHGTQLKFAAAAGGDGAVNYIKLQNEEMARAFLQMVNMLGQTATGSRALGGTFDDIASVAQFTIAKWFTDIFNEHVIEDDVEWNEGPDEEFAPLLAFDAGDADPVEGFDAALNEDEGIMDPNGEVEAMIRPVRRTTARRGTAARRRSGGGAVQAAQASPVPLPPRPLRRAPYEHEIRAAVDYAAMDSAYDSALELLVQEVRALQTYSIDELHDAIVDADGDLDDLAELSVEPQAEDVIHARLQQTATISIAQAAQEAARQGVEVPRQDVSDIADALRDRAGAVDRLLVNSLAQTASRHAVRLTGGGLSAAEVADSTRDYLRGLSGSYLRDVLGGAVQQATNAGRKLVFSRDGEEGDVYASELLDSNTCSRCTGIDGTPYDSLEAAERDYPTGGYKDCEGRERCRGTLVKVYKSEVPATMTGGEA